MSLSMDVVVLGQLLVQHEKCKNCLWTLKMAGRSRVVIGLCTNPLFIYIRNENLLALAG